MSRSICPICEAETPFFEECTHTDFIKYSLELDFLGLSFLLDPYGAFAEPEPEPDFPPAPQGFSPAPLVSERNPRPRSLLGKSVQIASVPMFLRL